MTVDARGFLTIGQFSRLSTISIRMLRHYDEQGVLPPAAVDEASGYRYYHPSQLATARLVASLRDIGCPVAMIGRLVPLAANPGAMARELDEQRERLVAELESARQRIDDVESMITTLKGDAMSTQAAKSIEITERTIPAYACASLRDVIENYQAEGQLWKRLAGALAEIDPALMGYQPPEGVPCSVALFHDEGYQESDVDVEVRWAMPATFPGSDAAPRLDVPAQRVLVGTLRGGFEGMGAVSEALGAAIGERGLTVNGPMFNVYIVSGMQSPNPADWITEVCLPIS